MLCQGPFFLQQRGELLCQILVQGATCGLVLRGSFLVPVERGFPEGQYGLAVKPLIVGGGGGLQCFAHLLHFALRRLALGQQQPQLRIVRITSQQVVQVGGGQGRVILGSCQAPLQVLARIQQPQRGTNHTGQQDRQPVRCENGAFNGRGRGSGYARKHGSAGRSGYRLVRLRSCERAKASVRWLGPGICWMPWPRRIATAHAP